MLLMKNISLDIKKITNICQQWQIIESALFGSVLREDFNDRSDIDILVSFADTASITFFALDTIEQQLSEIFHRLDVVTKRAIAPKPYWIRQKNILENTKVIYEQRLGNIAGYNSSL